MKRELTVNYLDFIMSISGAIELMNPFVGKHHRKVALIAFNIISEMESSQEDRCNLIIASLLHDVGALSMLEWNEIFKYEYSNPEAHAKIGHAFFSTSTHFSNIANIIPFHHTYWNNGAGLKHKGESIPIESHIIHLADRISVLIKDDEYILHQTAKICSKVKEGRGTMFMPELSDIFNKLSEKESFWLDIANPLIGDIIKKNIHLQPVELCLDEVESLARFFSKIIDFKSSFTSTHTSGVSASAEKLSKFFGYEERECQLMRIAGYFHDVGKLVVPTEILDKPGKLSENERAVIKSHTYYTSQIIDAIEGMETVNNWASLHHEHLDGSGYPFHYKKENFSLGSKIMAVADVFTALSEDRPYRKSMKEGDVLRILTEMVDISKLDQKVVSTLVQNYNEVNAARIKSQEVAKKEYQDFTTLVNSITPAKPSLTTPL